MDTVGKKKHKNEFNSVSGVLAEIDPVFMHHNPCGFLYERYQRIKAVKSASQNELELIYRLIESHVPSLRKKITLHYDLLERKDSNNQLGSDKKCYQEILNSFVNPKCGTSAIDYNIKYMLAKVEEMPKEWTIVHLTPQYNHKEEKTLSPDTYETNPLYMSVFNCGNADSVPFCLSIDVPKSGGNESCVEILSEMMSIIQENKDHLGGHSNDKLVFKNVKDKMAYFERGQRKEERLKNLINEVQNTWLKEWRCLLMGKYLDENIERNIREEIKGFFKQKNLESDLNSKTEQILCYITKGVPYLKLRELKTAVQYCVSECQDKTIVRELATFVRSLHTKLCPKNNDEKKHPVILVVHETLDCIPWEMLDILKNQTVTRLPSFHLVYFLFKVHQSNIRNGYKIVTDYSSGAYVVNPDANLPKMEVRMMSFFNYWLPNWIGISGYMPTSDEFCQLLTSSEIFSYNGHGSGFHIMGIDTLAKCNVKAVVLLFGCSSTKVSRLSPQTEMHAPYYVYLLARCPAVVGMLWEVTDTDTDILTAEFLSKWIPSEAVSHWKFIDKESWKKGLTHSISTTLAATNMVNEVCYEPDLSRALNLAKKELRYISTKAACVVRGLPVKIKTNK